MNISELQPYQQRVVDEKTELDERLTKLIAFFDNPIFAGLDAAEQERMKRQADHMTNYSVVLGERIAAFPA
jgi:hypothetical protein